MKFFHVFVNKSLPGRLVAAQSTRVFHPFMNCSFVSGKIPLWSCLMVTLLARVLHPFMNCSFVLGKIPLWSCLMVTLPAREPHSFMNCSYVPTETALWLYPVITNVTNVLQKCILCVVINNAGIRLNWKMILIIFYSSSNESKNRRLFFLSHYFPLIENLNKKN